jgi:hypothetical protein
MTGIIRRRAFLSFRRLIRLTGIFVRRGTIVLHSSLGTRRSDSRARAPSPDADGSIRQALRSRVKSLVSRVGPRRQNSRLSTPDSRLFPRPEHPESGQQSTSTRPPPGPANKKRAGREATLRRFVTAGLAVRERRVRGQGLANTDRNGPLPETRKRGRAGGSGRAVHEPGTEKSSAVCVGAGALRPLDVFIGLVVGRLPFSLTPLPALRVCLPDS